MSFFSDNGFYQFPELYHWALYTGIAAVLLVVASIAILVWSLLRSQKSWKISVFAAFCVCLGIWSLTVALVALQQLHVFENRLEQRPRITLAYVHYVLGTAYETDLRMCQIQFGIIVAVFIFLIVLGIRSLTHRLPRKTGKRSIEEQPQT